MKGSLIVVAFFAFGCLLGLLGSNTNEVESGFLYSLLNGGVVKYVLYILMLLVGISIGSDRNLKLLLKSIKPAHILLPIGTIVGTLLFTALVSLFIPKWGISNCLAVGSGFAYYSLSSILISELKEASLGVQLAAELATLGLITNIVREIFALLLAPLLYRYFGAFAPISVGGATTMDTTLPIITKCCGKGLVFVSIFHGVLVDFSVPLLVSLFCSI